MIRPSTLYYYYFLLYRSRGLLLVFPLSLFVSTNAWNVPLPGGGRIAYEDGLLRIGLEDTRDLPSMPPIDERVDPGLLASIEIRDTKTVKGFGAFSVKPIPKHSFLGFYQGIQRTCLDGLENTEYIMSLDGGETYLDGYEIARDRSSFSPVHLNHADKPQCNCLRILENKQCAFFTARDIEMGEELTFDYGFNYWRGREKDKI